LPSRSQLGVPLKSKFVLVGTPEDKTFKDPHELNLSQFPDTSDNFDVACQSEPFVPLDRLPIR
jgi:hypothetical protein